MNTEREIILKYTTKEERKKVMDQTKLLLKVFTAGFILFAASQYIVWLFAEYGWLNGYWDVVAPGEFTPPLIMLIGYFGYLALAIKWSRWSEPTKDERSIMKERYGVEYDTGEVDGPIEDDE